MSRDYGVRARRVIAIGIDGATWNIILPWVKAGKLPHFRAAISRGAWGSLTSVIPPITAPAWASLLTGMCPEKTGIYDFFVVKTKFPPAIRLASSAKVRKRNIITMLSDVGLRVAAINIPMMYPPPPVNGLLITGIDTPIGGKFAYPDELYLKLVKEGFFPEPRRLYLPGREEEFLSSIHESMEKLTGLFIDVLEGDYDFVMLFLRETDLVCHTFWRFMDKNHPLYPGCTKYSGAILKVYQGVDKLLGEAIRRRRNDDFLIIFSDHGFGPEYYRVNLNVWFLNKGYMVLKSDLVTIIKKGISLVIDYSRLWNFASRMKLINRVAADFKVKETEIGRRSLLSSTFLSIDDVDWDQTSAYAIGSIGRCLPVFLRDRRMTKRIVRDIFSLNCLLGRRVVRSVVVRRSSGDDSCSEEGIIYPDLFVMFAEPYAGHTLALPYIFESPSLVHLSPLTQSGAHTMQGILCIMGPKLAKGRVIRHAHIMDLMPTISAIFGINPPKDVDGDILPIIKDYLKEKNIRLSDYVRFKVKAKAARIRGMLKGYRATRDAGG